jgi:hypothetical protein
MRWVVGKLVIWMAGLGLLFFLGARVRAAGEGIPPWLPRYDLIMNVEPAAGRVECRLSATWTNMQARPTQQLVFNAHSRYVLPGKSFPLVAKTLELLRTTPSEALGSNEAAFQLHSVLSQSNQALHFEFLGDTGTTLVVNLPRAVGPGQSVTVVLDFTMVLPPKQGRWGRFRDITFLSNWLPVFAVYGEPPPSRPGKELVPPEWDPWWQPTPFVPWHQPFYNEAGYYSAKVRIPHEYQVACTGTITCTNTEGKQKWLAIQTGPVRDFAFLTSNHFQEQLGEADVGGRKVRVHVLAMPEHEHFAKVMVGVAARALEQYSKWLGAYPYDDFTVAESYLGWLGNQCGALVMIDARIFGMPHLAEEYVEYLVSHEVCHQWFYNVVGTNGYAETWMEEAMAEFFSQRLLDNRHGQNSTLFNFPRGLRWLPNVHRQDYRSFGLYGAIARGDNGPAVRDMPEFGHIANLLSMTYDKGSRIVATVEQRLGDTAFLDFMRRVCARYQYRILHVRDFVRELEEYTDQSWADFANHWLYGPGLSDWALESVEVTGPAACCLRRTIVSGLFGKAPEEGSPASKTRVVVILKQNGTYCEQTTLGIGFCGQAGFPIRLPILPAAGSYPLEEYSGSFQALGENRFRVELVLDEAPNQVMVDPDLVLVDTNPGNNRWHCDVRWRFTPLYTFLEETDLTSAYDRWNVIVGPWVYGAMYSDPWYTRSTMAGFRIGAVRTTEFYGGAYVAARQDYKDVVAGVDGVIDHWPMEHTQVGYNVERRLDTWFHGDENAMRGVLWGRYIFNYGSSMYLPPMHYIEAFGLYSDNFYPFARQTGDTKGVPNAQPLVQANDVWPGERFQNIATAGIHYRLNFLTPYWDPECGFYLDLTYEGGGTQIVETERGLQEFSGTVSWVTMVPDFSPAMPEGTLGDAGSAVLHWLGQSRLAFRAGGGIAMPGRGQFFALGGSTMLRGFDLSERQGSSVWIGSVEWRMPIAQGLNWDAADHAVSLRNLYGAAFYDVGEAYIQGKPIGTVAHSVGAGLRLDVAWFSFVERTTLRVDVAKTVNAETAVQVWFGLQQPF